MSVRVRMYVCAYERPHLIHFNINTLFHFIQYCVFFSIIFALSALFIFFFFYLFIFYIIRFAFCLFFRLRLIHFSTYYMQQCVVQCICVYGSLSSFQRTTSTYAAYFIFLFLVPSFSDVLFLFHFFHTFVYFYQQHRVLYKMNVLRNLIKVRINKPNIRKIHKRTHTY